MNLISWSDKYSVNNAVLDSQHKKMVSLINELHNAMSSGNGRKVLEQTLDELVRYTMVHFSTEEKFLRDAKYPACEEHIAEHDKLTVKTITLQKSFREGKPVLTMEVMCFLRDWLISHILESDKKYVNKIQV